MTYVITQNCCNDTSCVEVCPVNCIHPASDEAGYIATEMLYIDPDVCIECGACMDACPVAAIYPDYELPEEFLEYEQINAEYYRNPEHADYPQVANAPPVRRWDGYWEGPLRVAIVGSGPAACYAAEELMEVQGLNVNVDMFERLAAPFGLIRHGVAPDHQNTKLITERFSSLFRRPTFRIFLNTEVGRDISVNELQEYYHAVIFATGANREKKLGISGEELSGSVSAIEFVGWYNGHTDYTELDFDLSCERVVIVGNGNVALDAARILTCDTYRLELSDISTAALDALRRSNVRDVVIIGRRGPAEAALTSPELLGLISTEGIHVRVEGVDINSIDGTDESAQRKVEIFRKLPERAPRPNDRFITFKFLSSPIEILDNGDGSVVGIRTVTNELHDDGFNTTARPTDETEEIPCGLVLRSIGYYGEVVDGLPYDTKSNSVPNNNGRVVLDDTVADAGTYVVGWIKRGPSGVVGTNRACARETITSLLEDVRAGRIDTAQEFAGDIADLLPGYLDAAAWKRIDRSERSEGRAQGRPRVKLTDVDQLIKVGRGDG